MDNATFEPHGIHRIAGHFYKQSAEDYGAARCCLINGLFPGFVMAEQAVEKLIKGILLTADPSFKPKRGYGHDLAFLCAKLQETYPGISLSVFEDTIKMLQSCYDGRYPDSGTNSLAHTTAQLRSIDELYMYLDEQVPITGEMRLQIGALPLLYSAYVRITNIPACLWLLQGNEAAHRLLSGRPLPDAVVRWRDAFLKQTAPQPS